MAGLHSEGSHIFQMRDSLISKCATYVLFTGPLERHLQLVATQFRKVWMDTIILLLNA